MIENAKGFEAKSEKLNGNPNQMNIQSMYSDIDLDANAIEREFQDSLLQLLWFINQHLINIKVGDFTNEKVNIVFNRDILINET
ncbi:phage portal protein, partial [Streptobacillus moniliformis]|uniref:phage portal protein n=1 Tax=Streptobacillus moniliformis TaxID=34105 RepID=UPI001E340746